MVAHARPRPARRRRLRAALHAHAWQLSAASAVVFAAAFFGALAISFFTRPTRRYIFPLLTDIDAHHPESAILRGGTFVATVLLAATTVAAFLSVAGPPPAPAASDDRKAAAALDGAASTASDESDADPVDAPDDDVESLPLFADDDADSRAPHVGDTSGAVPSPCAASPDARRVLRQLRRRLAIATRANRRALVVLVVLALALVAVLAQGGFARLAAAYPVGATVDGRAGDAAAAGAAADAATPPQKVLSPAELAGAPPPAASAVVLLYSAAVLWTGMLVFLTWYFLRLQATAWVDPPAFPPDGGLHVLSEDAEAPGDASAPPRLATAPSLSLSSITLSGLSQSLSQSLESLSTVSSSLASLPRKISSSVSTLQSMDSAELHQLLVPRVRTFGWRVVAVVRPICLTAQLVSAIKVVGLLYALNSFSISKIRLIRLALLAALAFAEYTAAFFVAFFLLILAIDMRACREDERWRFRLQLGCATLDRPHAGRSSSAA
jgi:hypothetical protein